MSYPLIRYMGSKYRLLSWINDELSDIEYQSVLDAFSGSGAVSYLFKTLGKQVFSNDFLHFAHIMAKATVENSIEKIEPEDVDVLLSEDRNAPSFIFDTFKDVFFTHEELRFLDKVSFNVKKIGSSRISGESTYMKPGGKGGNQRSRLPLAGSAVVLDPNIARIHRLSQSLSRNS